jgi:hypothetical protein
VSSPSGRAARAASLLGDDYQHLLAWSEAVHAGRPGSDATDFRVEAVDAGSYDDISVLRHSGLHEHTQAKFAVNPTGGFGIDWLINPTGTRPQRQSLAQRALATHRDLAAGGTPVLRLVTNRTPDAADDWLPLYRGPDSTLGHQARRLLAGAVNDTSAPRALNGLRRLHDHLGCDETEFLGLLDAWQLHWAADPHIQAQLAASRMSALGLRDDDDAIRDGRDYIRRLVTHGRRSVPVHQLRADIEALDLRLRPPARVLSVSMILPDPFARDADEHVNLTPKATEDGDPAETPYEHVEQELRDAVDRLRTGTGPGSVLVRATVRLPVWFLIGSLMKHVEDWTLSTHFDNRVWTSNDHPAQTPQLAIRHQTAATASTDLLVGLSVTADVHDDVLAHTARDPALNADALWLTVERPSSTAVTSPAQAAAIVDQARAAITDRLRQGSYERVHLFIAAPRFIPLFLGHRWNRLPEAVVHRDLGPGKGYERAFTVR